MTNFTLLQLWLDTFAAKHSSPHHYTSPLLPVALSVRTRMLLSMVLLLSLCCCGCFAQKWEITVGLWNVNNLAAGTLVDAVWSHRGRVLRSCSWKNATSIDNVRHRPFLIWQLGGVTFSTMITTIHPSWYCNCWAIRVKIKQNISRW